MRLAACAAAMALLVPAFPLVAQTPSGQPRSADAAGEAQEAQLAPIRIQEWRVPGERQRPRDPYIDREGRVWFVGQAGNFIAYLEPESGEITRVEIEEGTHPHNLIVAEDGKVWYAGNRNATIGVYDPATKQFTHHRMPEGVRDPHTLVWDRNGDVFFTAQQSGYIGHLRSATGEVRTVKVEGERTRPYGIVVDAQNRAWVATMGKPVIVSVDPATMATREYPIGRDDAAPRRIGVTSDGMVWYVDARGGYLGRLDPNTGEIREWRSPRGGNASPYAMTVDDRDRIWYVETGPRGQPNQLVGFDPKTERFISRTHVPSGGGFVRHMTFDPANRVIWFGTDTHTIGRAHVP